MKKTTTTTLNIKKQEENVMRKEIKLEKFTDEDMIRYEWELNALYQGREHFIRDFQELYINGNCQIEKINNAIPMMIDYLNDFATSARVWDSILTTSKYKTFYAKKWEYDNKEMDETTKTRILNSYRPTENDTEQVVYRIYATIAVAVYNATFAPDGQYKVVKMAYREFKQKSILAPEKYAYTCANTSKCMAVYVKTGEYDPETKTIEVYIPANWDGDDAKWWCARRAGDLPEIAAEMAAQRAEEDEVEADTEPSLKEKFINAAQKAPKEFFADGVNGMTEDEVRAKLIEHYEVCDEDEFEENEICMHETDGDYEAICDALRVDAIDCGYIDKNAVIAKFYNFFNDVLGFGPMHMEIYYSKIMDWCIEIYKRGCADDYPDEQSRDGDAIVANIQFCSGAMAFAMAHGALRRWMKKYHNYEE